MIGPGARPAQAGSAARPVETGGLPARVKALLGALAGMFGDRVLLLSLELKLAKRALGLIAALMVAALVLALTAWTAFWLAIVGWLVALGLGWGWAALVVALVNAGGAVAVAMKARTLSHLLGLPATVRHLTMPLDQRDTEVGAEAAPPPSVTPTPTAGAPG